MPKVHSALESLHRRGQYAVAQEFEELTVFGKSFDNVNAYAW